MQREEALVPIVTNGDVKNDGHEYHLSGPGLAKVVMPKIDGIKKITGRFTTGTQQGKFGLMFNVGPNKTGALNLVFDPGKQQVAFYNTDTAKINKAKPEASPRGMFLAKRLTGHTNNKCISRDMKKIKAKDGKNQKPEVIVIYTTARIIDV